MPTPEERENLHKMAGFPEPPTAEEAMKSMKLQSHLQNKVDEIKRIEHEKQTGDFLSALGDATFWEHDYGTGRHIIHVNLSKLKKILKEGAHDTQRG